MPLATTFAGDSARAEGLFNIISLGQSYWAATLTDAWTTPSGTGLSVTTDSSGNVYVCGNGQNASNGQVAFVAKYNSSGTIQWQRTITDAYTTSGSYANCITLDSSGNVYVCGSGQNSTNNNYATVSKYDSSGTIQWQRVLYSTSGSVRTLAYGITLDSSGNVYVCGSATGNTLNLIYKLNSSGIAQWQKSLDDGSAPKVKAVTFQSIAIDSSGNLYVCGKNYNSANAQVTTVAKYNSSGTIQWQRSLTDTQSTPSDSGTGIVLDSSANVYVCGNGYNSASQYCASISKWDSSGNLQWQRTFTDNQTTSYTFAYGISVDSSSNIYVCGSGANSSNQTVMFITKWNSSGTIQFQRTITDTYSTPVDTGYGINVDSSGNMYVTGRLKNTVGNIITFIAKLPSDGSRTGTYSNSTFGFTYASSSWTVATSTWTAATTSYTDAAIATTEAASTWTNATSTWATSLVTV